MNRMKLEFLSCSGNERFARSVAAAFILELDPTLEELSEIRTAVSEAVTNAVVHGYGGKEGIITLEGRLEGNEVEFIVSDSGAGIEDIKKAREPLFTGKPEDERSGIGFTIMESFMDSLEVESAPGKGTRVIMRRLIEVEND
ncbi:MAG: anti-sigma F factor [Clostridia bacterium]|nr:anti-sigma F factor [Clostridia bacterium]